MSETLSIPVEVHETQYSLVSYGKGTTEFECDHIFFHREEAAGEFWERLGEFSHEYTGYVEVCDNPSCEEVLERTVEEECIA